MASNTGLSVFLNAVVNGSAGSWSAPSTTTLHATAAAMAQAQAQRHARVPPDVLDEARQLATSSVLSLDSAISVILARRGMTKMAGINFQPPGKPPPPGSYTNAHQAPAGSRVTFNANGTTFSGTVRAHFRCCAQRITGDGIVFNTPSGYDFVVYFERVSNGQSAIRVFEDVPLSPGPIHNPPGAKHWLQPTYLPAIGADFAFTVQGSDVTIRRQSDVLLTVEIDGDSMGGIELHPGTYMPVVYSGYVSTGNGINGSSWKWNTRPTHANPRSKPLGTPHVYGRHGNTVLLAMPTGRKVRIACIGPALRITDADPSVKTLSGQWVGRAVHYDGYPFTALGGNALCHIDGVSVALTMAHIVGAGAFTVKIDIGGLYVGSMQIGGNVPTAVHGPYVAPNARQPAGSQATAPPTPGGFGVNATPVTPNNHGWRKVQRIKVRATAKPKPTFTQDPTTAAWWGGIVDNELGIKGIDAQERAAIADGVVLTSWLPIYHNTGPHPCGGIAFYLVKPIANHTMVDIDLFRKPNGHRVPELDLPQCYACRTRIDQHFFNLCKEQGFME